MKTRTKVALTALCALLLVAASVLGTLAYLTSTTGEVENTFTAGNVTITLDETDVDLYGVQDGATRVDGNELKLVPNHSYKKDPTIHVVANSESCYVYVKVVNGLEAIEKADAGETKNTIASQMAANGWVALDGVDNVYYQTHTMTDVDKDYVVFDKLNIKADADVSAYATATNADAKITITGYAVQTDNFANAKAAWDGAAFGA